ncbi:hypothetical protein J1C67_14910 [Clostridium gasigenes]|uniref:hypothetical protein n=1 Tax=Clostridium gasigenes TaxID=94869 RepID=UPI0014382BB3|nr:hypothetical protein [Clostridium gasigenes]MBU3131629.1 hypothetical protein [Clostridium gasigenes]NKF05375.1 hypothetical protein [Clostridium gasigenes]QSW18825.1 hypothetical protein J1C67_14910 [Clostridium gasigenes]
MSKRCCCNRSCNSCCNSCCRRESCGCGNNFGGCGNNFGGCGFGNNCGGGCSPLIWLLLLGGGCF